MARLWRDVATAKAILYQSPVENLARSIEFAAARRNSGNARRAFLEQRV